MRLQTYIKFLNNTLINCRVIVMAEAEKFYAWLLKIKNIHLSDSERMARAYGIVIQNSNELKQKNENTNQTFAGLSECLSSRN